MEDPDIISLSIAALVAASFSLLYWRRRVHPRSESYWIGHGIDVALITHRVQRVRNDFLAGLHSRSNDGYRRKLLTSAKRAVRRLTYFRRRIAKPAGLPVGHEACAAINALRSRQEL